MGVDSETRERWEAEGGIHGNVLVNQYEVNGGVHPSQRPARKDGEVRIEDGETGGQKGQKLARYDLIPPEALDEIARVYGFGAAKYDDLNYLKGFSWRLSIGAGLRHIFAWIRSEDYDPESGLHHLAHAAWHMLTLMTFQWNRLGKDDRLPGQIERGEQHGD